MKDEKEEEMLRKKLKPRQYHDNYNDFNTGLCTGSNFNGRGTWFAIRNRLHLSALYYTVKYREEEERKQLLEDMIRNTSWKRLLTPDMYNWWR